VTVPQWIYLKDSLKRYAQMASIQQTLSSITYSISVYVGFCIVIFGLFGNLINLLVFTQLKYFRKNQSVLYLMSILIVECFQLIFATTTRIVTSIFNYDPTRTSLSGVKFEYISFKSEDLQLFGLYVMLQSINIFQQIIVIDYE